MWLYFHFVIAGFLQCGHGRSFFLDTRPHLKMAGTSPAQVTSYSTQELMIQCILQHNLWFFVNYRSLALIEPFKQQL